MPQRKSSTLVQMKVRVRKDLRERLQRAADAQDRPLSHEVSGRLEQSFKAPEDLASAFGGGRNLALFRSIAGAIQYAETSTGKRWDTDDETRQLVMLMALRAIKSLSGTGAWHQRMAKVLMGDQSPSENTTNDDDWIAMQVIALERGNGGETK